MFDHVLYHPWERDCLRFFGLGKYILVEFKTGYTRYWKDAQGKMVGPLKEIPNSPLWHAYTQAAAGAVMYAHTFPGHPIGQVFVVRTDYKSTEFYEAKPPFIALVEGVVRNGV